LVEAGVRFVELSYGDWDQHRNLKADHAKHALAVDKPIAGFVDDAPRARIAARHTSHLGRRVRPLRRTLKTVIGRDHNNKGYSIWMAGGGVKPGIAYGPDRRARV